ncbi:MAG TPA: hypothetical protein VGK48_24915 [Terriglobia bacterium]
MARAFGVLLLVLALASFIAPVSLQAQHRGGGAAHSGGSVASRPSGSFGPVAPFRSAPVTGFGRAPIINSRPVIRPVRPARPVVVAPIYGYGYGYGYYPPYDAYSPYYGYGAGPGYVEPAYSEQQPVYVPGPGDVQPSGQSDSDLSYQVGRLTQEVEQLRQQQAASQAPSTSASMPVVLVFRDGHRLEIQNYAIIGQTFWVLDDKHSSKIPLSDLDLDATQKENQARGLRFSVPSR